MFAITLPHIDAGRKAGLPGDPNGCFVLRCPASDEQLRIIASDGYGWKEEGHPGEPWEHVSVSTPYRCPTWAEMCWVKDQFWDAEEWVIQYHPARSVYINNHEFTLHLWRPTQGDFPKPPKECV